MQRGAGNQAELVGILSLQGCVAPHETMLDRIGVKHVRVREPEDLAQCSRLIMPGGESSTMLRLINSRGLAQPLVSFAKSRPIWGICAGAILCANEVKNPDQSSLGLIDIAAHRNFYGSQLYSFKAVVDAKFDRIEADFIRAPLLNPLSPKVEVLASFEGQPVLMRQDLVMVSSFHTELGSSHTLHSYFLSMDIA